MERQDSPTYSKGAALMTKPLSQFAGLYREWKPPLALRDHLSCIWINDLTRSSVNDFLVAPDGCVDILWNTDVLYVAGPDTRPVPEVVRPVSLSGIRFRPGAAHLWLGAPLSEICNSRVPLAEFWKEDAGILAEHLSTVPDSTAATTVLHQALLSRLSRVGPADRQVAFLRREAAVTSRSPDAGGFQDLSRRIGLSERTLRRRCTEVFGYGFKTLQRILRFQRLLRRAAQSPGSNLASLALECGFADHAHMSREVRALCEATPSQLVVTLSR
jgi:AraC-like DNA-binding protein